MTGKEIHTNFKVEIATVWELPVEDRTGCTKLLKKPRLSKYPLSWAKEKTDFELKFFLVHEKNIPFRNLISLATSYLDNLCY